MKETVFGDTAYLLFMENTETGRGEPLRVFATLREAFEARDRRLARHAEALKLLHGTYRVRAIYVGDEEET